MTKLERLRSIAAGRTHGETSIEELTFVFELLPELLAVIDAHAAVKATAEALQHARAQLADCDEADDVRDPWPKEAKEEVHEEFRKAVNASVAARTALFVALDKLNSA